MDATARDDITHALAQTMAFYGKKLDPTNVRFWLNALSGREPEAIKIALLEYTKSGRYAPKPVDIIELIAAERRKNDTGPQTKQLPHKPCPPEISQAWLWFLSVITDGSQNLDGAFGKREVTPEQQEKNLLIVNQEARRTNTPDAIPEEYKLAEAWG